jgi:hypothetical protein
MRSNVKSLLKLGIEKKRERKKERKNEKNKNHFITKYTLVRVVPRFVLSFGYATPFMCNGVSYQYYFGVNFILRFKNYKKYKYKKKRVIKKK